MSGLAFRLASRRLLCLMFFCCFLFLPLSSCFGATEAYSSPWYFAKVFAVPFLDTLHSAVFGFHVIIQHLSLPGHDARN